MGTNKRSWKPGDRVVVDGHNGVWRIIRITYGIVMLERADGEASTQSSDGAYVTPRHATSLDKLKSLEFEP